MEWNETQISLLVLEINMIHKKANFVEMTL